MTMNDKQVVNAALRDYLSLFIQRTFKTVSPADQYLHNWHIDALAHVLTLVAQRKIKRLIVTMPPRHMKSISISVAFTAWLLGHDPRFSIICVSYAQELATKFSIDTRAVMESGWYAECFPGTVLTGPKNTQSELTTSQQGFRLATSVGGPLTGRGCNFLIIDDPHKADDAMSVAKRQAVLEWYRQTAISRLNDPENDCIVLVQQRLHEDDLVGTLLESEGWVHLNLSAIAEQRELIDIGPDRQHLRQPGDVLHPRRISKERLKQYEAEMGSAAFAAQYQQRPGPAGGGVVKLDWFRRYAQMPRRRRGSLVVQSWDQGYTTADTSNPSVCLTFLFQDGHFYLIDVLRVRVEYPELLRLIPDYRKVKQADFCIVEAVGAGVALWQQLARLDPHVYRYTRPKDDKVMRLTKLSPLIESGQVWLPQEAPWLNGFLQELQYFPNGKYDDQVDALSQALTWLKLQPPEPEPPPAGFERYEVV